MSDTATSAVALSKAAPPGSAHAETAPSEPVTGSDGADTTGAELWSHALVGGIQHVVDWWMTKRTLSADEVVDYLTMMVWSAVVGVWQVNGSREKFLAAPPALFDPPPADPLPADPASGTPGA